MPYPLCRHIKTNGLQCEAPSLTGESFCYFHTRLHQRHAAFRHTDRTRGYLVPGQHIELAPIEDRDSVQLALSLVINALAAGQLETRRATALLYGLQLASANSGPRRFDPLPSKLVRRAESTPEGLDLAEPGATLNLPSDRQPGPDPDPNFEGDDSEQETITQRTWPAP